MRTRVGLYQGYLHLVGGVSRVLLDWQKEFNTQVNKIRWVIEQVIANFKTLSDHPHGLPAPD